VWQFHFGRGIVGTPSDLGLKGERPSHPALLDWLTSEFMNDGWSLKKLHRLIMASSTYQQSSALREQAAGLDPEDKLLWRFPIHRLEGEAIRDSALSVAGLLNPKMSGPSIFPELPTGMPAPRGGWKVDSKPAERNRRSIYVFVRRNTRYPLFDSLDMPDPHESCARRNVTTSPIQALHLFNSKMTLEWAQHFAGRVIQAAGMDSSRQIDTAYRLAFGRVPDSEERETVKDFLKHQEAILAERSPGDEQPPFPMGLPEEVKGPAAAALVDFCHTLLNANEFVYLN
jgi:hypothetical protein